MKKYRISKSAVCVLFAVLFMFVVAISAYAVDIDGDGIDDGDIVETEVYTDPEYTEPYTEPETYPETETSDALICETLISIYGTCIYGRTYRAVLRRNNRI